MLISYTEKKSKQEREQGVAGRNVFSLKTEWSGKPHWEAASEQRCDGGKRWTLWSLGVRYPGGGVWTGIPVEAPCPGCLRMTRRSPWLEWREQGWQERQSLRVDVHTGHIEPLSQQKNLGFHSEMGGRAFSFLDCGKIDRTYNFLFHPF